MSLTEPQARNGAPAESPAPTPALRLPLPLHRPLWTYALLAVNVLVWVAMTLAGGSENPVVLVRFGAKYNPFILAGQYWRLLTACFVHVGILHLAFNAYALFSFGGEIERRFGRARFLALYLLAGLTGSVLSFLGSRTLSAGASGAIFGLVGASIVYYALYREEFGRSGRRQLTNILVVAGYNLAWGLATPGIDNLGHIGGLLAGLALGWAYCPRYRLRHSAWEAERFRIEDRWERRRAMAVTLGLVVLLWGLTVLGAHLQSQAL